MVSVANLALRIGIPRLWAEFGWTATPTSTPPAQDTKKEEALSLS